MEDFFSFLGVWCSCSLLTTITLGALYWSSYNLVGITVTRYICIQNPLTISTKLTPCRTLSAVIIIAITCWCTTISLHTRTEPPGESIYVLKEVKKYPKHYIVDNPHFAVHMKCDCLFVWRGDCLLSINMERINSQHFTVHMNCQLLIIDAGDGGGEA